jgi:hypothetical protein
MRFWAAVIDPAICAFAVVALVIAAVSAVVISVKSPSWMDPPEETVCEPVPVAEPWAALFEPVPLVLLVLLAALLAEFVPVADPFPALFEPVPLVLLVLLAALLFEPVPLAEPLPLLFEPVPDFEPPFLVFEPV